MNNLLKFLTSAYIDFSNIRSIFPNLNKLGLVLGCNAYPVTLAPSNFKNIQSQLPLKPVWPVTNTFFPAQNLLLKFKNNCLAVVTTGFTMQQYNSPAIELYGSKGTIQMLGDDWEPKGFEIWRNKRSSLELFKTPYANWPWASGCYRKSSALLWQSRPQIPSSDLRKHAFRSGGGETAGSLG